MSFLLRSLLASAALIAASTVQAQSGGANPPAGRNSQVQPSPSDAPNAQSTQPSGTQTQKVPRQEKMDNSPQNSRSRPSDGSGTGTGNGSGSGNSSSSNSGAGSSGAGGTGSTGSGGAPGSGASSGSGGTSGSR